MKKITAALMSATMALSMGATLPQGLYEPKTVAVAAGETKFDETEFFVVVGNYGSEEYTQLRYFVQKSDGSFSAEKIVWENAPEGLEYGDVLTAEGKFTLQKIYPTQDPVYAMASYYKLSDDAKLNKVGNCSALMEQKELAVKSVDYDGSAHWSVRYTDESGEKEYYYGLSTYASTLGVNPIEGNAGDVYSFAMINGNVGIPLAKKNVTEEMPTYRIVKLPDKLEYQIGERIDINGIEVEVTKGDEEPVVYTYPDVAFDYQSNIPKSPTVVLSTNFRNDEAGTYSVKVAGTDVGFNVKVVDDNTVIEGKDLGVFMEGEMMKLKDVVELSKKGEDLCWGDFVKYKGVDVGSGLFILEYDLGNGYKLHVGGTPYTSLTDPTEIMYAYLSHNEKTIDIRTDDVGAFIAEIKNENDPTALQGTKEMTLYDVRYLALIGDFLEWSDFADFKGRDVGSGQNVWEFELPKGFVLRVCGVTGEKPSLIELSRDGEKGIDIRKDDVSSYIATKEMTLDDVKELAKKGTALDWSDFEDFKCHDASTCIRNWEFDLGDGFELEVGGLYDSEPNFIILNYYSSSTCDVRKEDVSAFIDNITAKYIIVKGDANFDHSMDMADVVFIMQCLANPNKYQFTEQGRINADMDGNGITVADAQTIQMMLLGYDISDIIGVDRLAIAGKNFVYEKEGFGGGCNIRFQEDGTFLYSPGYLSSYLGGGTWKISGNKVILTQENDGMAGKRVNYFKIEGNTLIFVEEGSDNLFGLTVKDGEKFSLAVEEAETATKLSDIVSIKTPYKPAMSDWSGIGILLEVDSPDYPITLKASDGHFTEWDIKAGSGPVKNVGKTYDTGKTGYIFWTPDDLQYKDGYNSEITVVGVSGDVFIDFGKIYITKADNNSLVASFEKPETATDSAKLLGLKDSKIKSVNVTSRPNGYDFTFIDEKAQKFIDFLSDMDLITDFSEDPGQLDGMAWVIKLEYENDEAMTLYDIGGYIRSENNSWFKYEYDYDSPLNTLIWKLSK